jgi:hypothetical protein
MLNFPDYPGALRCVGQALQQRKIEVFELKSYGDGFHLLGGDPNPPHIALLELDFSLRNIEVLHREGQARRGRSPGDVRFDSISETLRVIGKYIGNERRHLRRIDNSCPSISDDPIVEIEYQTRAGDVQTEKLTMSFIREACVQMYRRRTPVSNPINILTRKPRR